MSTSWTHYREHYVSAGVLISSEESVFTSEIGSEEEQLKLRGRRRHCVPSPVSQWTVVVTFGPPPRDVTS